MSHDHDHHHEEKTPEYKEVIPFAIIACLLFAWLSMIVAQNGVADKAEAELAHHDGFELVDVAIKGKQALLSGHVETAAQKEEAAEIISGLEDIAGIKANDIEIGLPPEEPEDHAKVIALAAAGDPPAAAPAKTGDKDTHAEPGDHAPEPHKDGHGKGEQPDTHAEQTKPAKASHGDDEHGAAAVASQAEDSHAKDSQAKDSQAKDSHADNSQAEDSHAEDGHSSAPSQAPTTKGKTGALATLLAADPELSLEIAVFVSAPEQDIAAVQKASDLARQLKAEITGSGKVKAERVSTRIEAELADEHDKMRLDITYEFE